jgi:hypothetical protein
MNQNSTPDRPILLPSTPASSPPYPLLPFFQTIPGTPDNTSPDLAAPPHTTYNTMIRKEYLGMLIRTRRRRRLRRTKRPTPTTTTRTFTPRPDMIPPDTQPSSSSAPTSDDSTDLYYRAYANHRLEMGESNAESALRDEKIKEDIKHMKAARKHQRKQARQKRGKITHKELQPPTLHTHTSTEATLTNNVNLHTDYDLYPNQDQCLTTQALPFIYDTGAAISMISSDPVWAWSMEKPAGLHIQHRRMLCRSNLQKPTNGGVPRSSHAR